MESWSSSSAWGRACEPGKRSEQVVQDRERSPGGGSRGVKYEWNALRQRVTGSRLHYLRSEQLGGAVAVL